MKILWAEKMARVVNGNYEYQIDNVVLNSGVRIYTPKGVFDADLKKLKRMIPKDFELTGIFYCSIEKQMYLLINQK